MITIGVTISFGYLFSLFFAWRKGDEEVQAIDKKLLFQYSKNTFSDWCHCCCSNMRGYAVKVRILIFINFLILLLFLCNLTLNLIFNIFFKDEENKLMLFKQKDCGTKRNSLNENLAEDL